MLCKREINGELYCCYATGIDSIRLGCFISLVQSVDKLTEQKPTVGAFSEKNCIFEKNILKLALRAGLESDQHPNLLIS